MIKKYLLPTIMALGIMVVPAILPGQPSPPLLPSEELKDLSKPDDHFLKEFLSMLTTLGLLIAFIFLASWFLKKMLNNRIQQMNLTSDIKISERRALTPKTTLYLLEIKGKGVAIAESSNGITLLGSYIPEAAGGQSSNDGMEEIPDFGKILEKKIDKESNH